MVYIEREKETQQSSAQQKAGELFTEPIDVDLLIKYYHDHVETEAGKTTYPFHFRYITGLCSIGKDIKRSSRGAPSDGIPVIICTFELSLNDESHLNNLFKRVSG